MEWVNIIVQGVLVGGLYTLYATGLSLMFGVMRFVNTAHGDFIVLSAYFSYFIISLGIPALPAAVSIVIIMAFLGYAVQSSLFNKITENGPAQMIVMTIGISIAIQNILLQIFTADTRRNQIGELEVASFSLGSISVGVFSLMIFFTALALIILLELIFYRTKLGMAFRAVSDNPKVAELMGINHLRIYGYATAIVFAVIALAGFYLSIRTNFDPIAGPSRLIYAFEAVIIGGVGNLWGTLLGGVLLGVAQSIGAKIDPGWQTLAGHLVFLVILFLKPDGLLKSRTLH